MIIDCISDLHGHYPKHEGGDLLIVAGDLTARDTTDQFDEFFSWLSMQNYKRGIVVGGNHDNLLQKGSIPFLELDKPFDISIDYLCDSGTAFEYYDERFPEEDEGFLPSGKRTLKIWGSPWTKTFPGMNPKCKAFTVDTEEELAEKWSLIPDDVDILITHSPPSGRLLDKTIDGRYVGSESLYAATSSSPGNLQLHIFGHIHEAYGDKYWKPTKYVNASHVNERYEPVNKPIRVIL